MKSSCKLIVCLAAALAATTAHAQYGKTPIRHVIVIFQENRTPEFQGLCTANGGVPGCTATGVNGTYNIASTYVNRDGQTVPLKPVGLATNFDLDHSHGGPKRNGTISGWDFEFTYQGVAGKPAADVPTDCGANTFGCVVPADDYSQFMYVYNTPVTNSNDSKGGLLDPYITMATTYGWANRMFQTNQGPSYPAHQFIFRRDLGPTADDDEAGVFAAENGTGSIYGCGSGESVQLIRPNGDSTPAFWNRDSRRRNSAMFYTQRHELLIQQAVGSCRDCWTKRIARSLSSNTPARTPAPVSILQTVVKDRLQEAMAGYSLIASNALRNSSLSSETPGK